MAWVMFTRRTNDPKLAWLERRLRAAGIPSRRNRRSFHAPILEVPEEHLDRAREILALVDDVDDDDPRFLKPEPHRKRKAKRKAAARGRVFYVLPESVLEAPYTITLPHDDDAVFLALRKVIGTTMLEPFMLPGFYAYGDEDARMKMRQPNPWLRGNGTVFNVVGTIVLGRPEVVFSGLSPTLVALIRDQVIDWSVGSGGPPGGHA
jgi:hypothetical protein